MLQKNYRWWSRENVFDFLFTDDHYPKYMQAKENIIYKD